MSERIEALTTTILQCMTNAPTPESGARLAAYRVTDELRKAMSGDAAVDAMVARMDASSSLLPTRVVLRGMAAAAWDAVLGEDDAA